MLAYFVKAKFILMRIKKNVAVNILDSHLDIRI